MIAWKNALTVCVLAGLISARLPAADAAATTPSPANTPAPAANAPSDPPAAAPDKAPRMLRHILIAESVEAAEKLFPAPDSPFVVLSPGLASFDSAEINKRLAAGLNRPIEEKILAAIAQVIEGFFRQNEYPAATVIVPTQNIAEGGVRILVLLGARAKNIAEVQWKIRNIKMQGSRWFSESLLREKLRIEQGEKIRYAELDQAISWTNNNPYRRVRVQLDPVPNNTGEADLTIAVQDALPLRLSATYTNSGQEATGRSQYIAAVSYANLWGLDHQASYQYITTDTPKYFQAHGFDYRVPLPWRHFVQLSGSLLSAKPEFFEGLFVQKGETLTADLRYTVPLRMGDSPQEIYALLNFKQSNNNLAYGGTQVLGTKTDIFQLTLGGSTILRDRKGAWAFGGSLTASPGGINSRNTDRAFDAERHGAGDSARLGARARYAFVTLSAQRLLNLAPGWDVSLRSIAQFASANLLASEQLTVGGAATVRGFREGLWSGDNGFVLTSELLLPTWRKPLPRISKSRGPLETRPHLFLDMAHVRPHERFPTDPRRVPIAGAGVGLRMNLSTNFSLGADYGWQVTSLPYRTDEESRGHLRATLAF